MSVFVPPSKEDLKAKYHITEHDFQILINDCVPEPSALALVGQHLEPVAQLFSVPTFMLKSRAGLLLGIVFVAI